MKTSIINARILTMDQEMTEYRNGFLTMEEDEILDLGRMENFRENGEKIIDGEGGILMPGMINTHTHLAMIPFRSLGDDVKDRLRRFLLPLENRFMNPRLAYAAAKYAIGELLLSGVTCCLDMYYFEAQIAKATEDMQFRAMLGQTIMQAPTPDFETPVDALAYAEHLIRKYLDHPMIYPCIAPHATNTNTLETLVKSKELSDKYQVPISMHVAEMDYEMEYFKEMYQMTPITFLEHYSLLSDRFIAAHCIHLNQNDITILKKTKTKVAHCIGSNTKSAKGIAPVAELLHENIPVGLASDGATSGNTLDLFSQFKLFANFHKYINGDRSVFTAKEIVSLGTIGGAKVLGRESQIGSLEAGKQADIVLLENKSVNMFPMFDPYSVLIYSSNSSNVRNVYVAGRCLVSEKELVYTPLAGLQEELWDAMQELRQSDLVQKGNYAIDIQNSV